MVHNEDQARLDAQQAIKESALCVKKSEEFSAHWIFNNKEDASETIFDDYGLPFDSGFAQEIYAFLGDKAHRMPIILLDRMIIQVLSQKTRSGKAQ